MAQCVSPGRQLHNHQMLMFVCVVISSILEHELTSRPLTVVGQGGSTEHYTNAPLCFCSHLPLLLCPSVQKTMAPSKPMFTAGMGRGEGRGRVARKNSAQVKGQNISASEDADIRSYQRKMVRKQQR